MSDIDSASSAAPFLKGGPVTRWLRKKMNDDRPWSLIAWSVIIGLVSGLVVGLFRGSVVWLNNRMTDLYAYTKDGHWWVLALIVAGSFLLSWLLARIVKTAPLVTGSGIPDVEQRLRSDNAKYWHWWKVLWRKFVGGLMAMGPGLFLGWEGPSVQLGASVGLGCSNYSDHTARNRHTFVSCGAAAGLCAAFTAPLASVIFVAEEVYSRFTTKVFICSFVATVSAAFTTILLLGQAPGFMLPVPRTIGITMWWQFILIGIGLGCVASLYEKTLFGAFNFYSLLRIPRMLRIFIPFLLMIPFGLFLPVTLGSGNSFINIVSNSNTALWLLVVMFIIRLIGSQLSSGSGAPGGLFLPILTLGAAFGLICSKLLVMAHVEPGSAGYCSVIESSCMAGLLGATVQCPLTAIVLVVEMTGYSNLIPMSIVTLCACIVYDLLGGKPVYDELAGYQAKTLWRHMPEHVIVLVKKKLFEFFDKPRDEHDGRS
ncbi:MAG: ClC family H(+)/Cl(-) exchange transporter [Aeriscardovia sp.]|nr:ClC family H(+)/Cl(-) exchange transporter [Aeriscardovia sp.]